MLRFQAIGSYSEQEVVLYTSIQVGPTEVKVWRLRCQMKQCDFQQW